jgi:hypothetical protein
MIDNEKTLHNVEVDTRRTPGHGLHDTAIALQSTDNQFEDMKGKFNLLPS